MNELVSGAIGVSIQLNATKIYMPDIFDLRDKVIKYIDVCDELIQDLEGRQIDASNSGFINLVEKDTTNLKINDLPLDMLSLSENKGNRFKINFKCDLVNSYINWEGETNQNKSIYIIFWFDEPKTMQQITNNNVKIDSFEIPIIANGIREVSFKENRTLYRKKFRNLLLFAPSISNMITAEGNNSMTDTQSKNIFLTLQLQNYAYIRHIPIYVFKQNAVNFEIRLQNVEFDFTNSYLEMPSGLSYSGTSVMFNAVYQD